MWIMCGFICSPYLSYDFYRGCMEMLRLRSPVLFLYPKRIIKETDSEKQNFNKVLKEHIQCIKNFVRKAMKWSKFR